MPDLNISMHLLDLYLLMFQSYSRNHLCFPEPVAVEELAFEDVQTVVLAVVLLQLAAVVMQLPAVVVLFLDFLQPVLLALLLLDKDHFHQRIHKCNQLIHLDQLRSARKTDALPESLLIIQQLPVTDHLSLLKHLRSVLHSYLKLLEHLHRSD